jgi:two-component system sensor histidine kinase FlrB
MAANPLELIDSRRSELKEAFRAFGAVSEQLSGAFEALRAQVAQLIDALPGGVLMLDAEGAIRQFNPVARELLGEPLLAQPLAAVMARAVAGTTGEYTELRCGRFVTLLQRGLPGGGELVLLTDVTEAHLMQILLKRQQRLLTLGELTAGLAHQIRTPLAAALLYASQMTLPGRDPADLTRCAERTVTSLKQLDKLVNDMLAFAHGGAARETVSVSALLEQVAQWLRPALRAGIRLTIRTQAPQLAVRANAPSLVSAVLNLATNALQAAAADLNLELLARRGDAGRAQIVVSDDGPGIPAHIRERIFEPFFTTRSRGTGIGLAIVKSVVEAHQGSVTLADTERGATFIIELPAEGSA